MRILQVGPNSVHLSTFISAIESDQNEIYLLSEESCDFSGIAENFVVSFRTFNPLKIIFNTWKIKKIIRSLQLDVVHIHQINRLAFFVSLISKKLDIRTISTAWGSDVLLIPQKNILFHYMVKQTLNKSTVVTADSDDMIVAMKKMLPNKKYILLQYGIDPIKATKKENIIYSNRLHEPLYQIDKVISFFADFYLHNQTWRLVIAGTGSESEKLKNLVKSLGLESQISFVGWQQKEENRAWYAKSAIYISIPKSDGTSVSVLEAMSGGCIPVVSDLPVAHEWIKSGKNGIIENPICNPLEQAITLNQKECALYNADLIQQKATREASTRIFMGLYITDNLKKEYQQ
jgi:glycosyltransferase involved in cell wall biosynthesis